MDAMTDRSESPGDLADQLAEYLFSANFVHATLSGPMSGSPWLKVIFRPVMLRGRRVIAVSRYDRRRSDQKNIADPDDPWLVESMHLPFRHATIHLDTRLIQVRVTKKGRVLVSSKEESAIAELSHDRSKRRWIPEDAAFLEVAGIARNGKVIPSQARKYRQVNEFVRSMAESPNFVDVTSAKPVRVVDYGCGNAYLSFALYHYLAIELNLPCEMLGIDINPETTARNSERARILEWHDVNFLHSAIRSSRPLLIERRPAIVVALHACDTATDDAIAEAVSLDAPLILVAPCCHHDIQSQLSTKYAPSGFEAIMRNDLLRERLGDLLTESARISLLGVAGYRSQVLQFASLTDTAKNLLIRSVLTGRPNDPKFIREYQELLQTWKVEPYLGKILATGQHDDDARIDFDHSGVPRSGC